MSMDAIGRVNENCIVDTRLYGVEFPSGGVTELMVNFIDESMYAHNDANEYKYLLFDLFLDCMKSDEDIKSEAGNSCLGKSLSLEDPSLNGAYAENGRMA